MYDDDADKTTQILLLLLRLQPVIAQCGARVACVTPHCCRRTYKYNMRARTCHGQLAPTSQMLSTVTTNTGV